jgi:hypothetical protein
MKSKLFFVSFLFVTVTLFSGCQKAKSLLDIKVKTDFKAPINMTATATQGISNTTSTYNYGGTYTLVPKDNPDVEKYANKIKDATITSLTATFSNVSTPVTISNFSINIKDLSNGIQGTITYGEAINVTEGGSHTFDLTSSQAAEYITVFETAMKDTDQIKITVSATGDANATFTSTLDMGTTITVNPLN